MLIRHLAALAVFVLALPLRAAVPGQVDFQGLLLDAAGEKVNGAVDLVFRLYDAPSAGTLLWTESHADVQVADGVYGVTLGAVTPLTQEVLAVGNVYLEIQVESETLTPRRQLLAVPYALRAENADNVNGVAGAFYSEIIENFDFDGEDPPNNDPREGTVDVDGDGRANFMDPDNDGDGALDGDELAAGTDIDLVTPVITSFSPQFTSAAAPQTITVQGSNFEPGMFVVFGIDHPTPTNVTPTSFQVVLGPQIIGANDVVVTRANGEHDSATYNFYGRRVFLSNPNNGNLGGVAGADFRCSGLASAIGLTGTYLAWIADASTSPAARFVRAGPAWTRPDGTKIADDWADLTDGTLDAPISAGTGDVWTGVGTDGNPVGQSCSNWTSSGGMGRRGLSNAFNSFWTTVDDVNCGLSRALYCFEQ